MKTKAIQPQYITIGGKRVVVLEETDYERLARQADTWEPPMPEPDSGGNYPALAAMAVSLARDILRGRRRLGWSQAELARKAGIRLETLNRIEQGKGRSNEKIVEKIDIALKSAESEL